MSSLEKRTRIHDLKTVYHDFSAFVELVRSGYSFTVEEGEQVLKQLSHGLELLKKEIKALEETPN